MKKKETNSKYFGAFQHKFGRIERNSGFRGIFRQWRLFCLRSNIPRTLKCCSVLFQDWKVRSSSCPRVAEWVRGKRVVAEATDSPLNIPRSLNMSLVTTAVDCCCKHISTWASGTLRRTDRQTGDRWHTSTMAASPLTSTPGWGVGVGGWMPHKMQTTGGQRPYQDGTCSRLPTWLADNQARAWTEAQETAAKSKGNTLMPSCLRGIGGKHGSRASRSCDAQPFSPFHDLVWLKEARFCSSRSSWRKKKRSAQHNEQFSISFVHLSRNF